MKIYIRNVFYFDSEKREQQFFGKIVTHFRQIDFMMDRK